MLNTPFSPWPNYTQEEVNAISKVLLSNKVNYWTGDECHEFEKEFATFVGTDYAVSLMNGTVALDLALKVLGVGEGDEVVVTSRTFIASVSSIVNTGAIPIFADVDRNTQNISPQTISEVLTLKTKAIIAVHLAGWPCDMDGIMELAEKNNVFVIEDCAQAHGATINGRSVGSMGHIGAWSFCQDKIMTTGGEGGMVTTNDYELWSKMWSYKDHGKSYYAVFKKKHPPGFRWLHDSFGTNWRMTEMQATIGRIQIRTLSSWVETRRRHGAKIDFCCEKIKSLRVPKIPSHFSHARYKYYVFVRPELLKNNWNRDRIVTKINEMGVPCYQGSCSEVYLEKAFDKLGLSPKNRLPIAKELGETSLMFLVHPTLTVAEIDQTCQAIQKVFLDATI